MRFLEKSNKSLLNSFTVFNLQFKKKKEKATEKQTYLDHQHSIDNEAVGVRCNICLLLE